MVRTVLGAVLRSPRVRKLIEECGATPVGPGAVRAFTFTRRPSDPGPYHVIDLAVGDRSVQVVVSPSGRNVHVAVDGEDVPRG